MADMVAKLGVPSKQVYFSAADRIQLAEWLNLRERRQHLHDDVNR